MIATKFDATQDLRAHGCVRLFWAILSARKLGLRLEIVFFFKKKKVQAYIMGIKKHCPKRKGFHPYTIRFYQSDLNKAK